MRRFIIVGCSLMLLASSAAAYNPLSDNGTQYIAAGYRQPYSSTSLHTGIDIATPNDTGVKCPWDSNVYLANVTRHGSYDSAILACDGAYGWQSETAYFHHADKGGMSWAQAQYFPQGQLFGKTIGDHVHIEHVDGGGQFVGDSGWNAATRHPGYHMSLCFGDNMIPEPMTENDMDAVEFEIDSGQLVVRIMIMDMTYTDKASIPTHYLFRMHLKHDQQAGETPQDIERTIHLDQYSSANSFEYVWQPHSMTNRWAVVFRETLWDNYNLDDVNFSYWYAYAQDYCGNAGAIEKPEDAAEYSRNLFDFDVTDSGARLCVDDKECRSFIEEFGEIEIDFQDSGGHSLGELTVPSRSFCDDCFTVAADDLGGTARACVITGITYEGERDLIISLVDDNAMPAAVTMGLTVFPNPGNPRICVKFDQAKAGPGTVQIYDVAGRHVWTAPERNFNVGNNQVWWDGQNMNGERMATGVFFVMVTSDTGTEATKLVLLK